MAKEFFGYFDSTATDDRVYVADEFAQAFRVQRLFGIGRGLEVTTAGGMKVKVAPGAAQIYGYTYTLTDDGSGDKTLTLESGGAQPRIDRIVLRLDLTTAVRTITLMAKKGTQAATPKAPALTNTETVKEISLCQVRVAASAATLTSGNLTDERLDPAVCGLLVPEEIQPANMDTKYGQTPLVSNLTTTGAGTAALDAAQGPVITGLIATAKTEAIASALASAKEEAGKTLPKAVPVTLKVGDWSASAPYLQTVLVSGLTTAMSAVADVQLSDTAATAQAQLTAYGCIGRIKIGPGSITALCYEDKPEADLSINLLITQTQ